LHCANNLLVGDTLYITYGNHVKAIDIYTSEQIFNIYLSGAVDADGVAMANDGFLYIVTHNNRIYKVDVELQTAEVFINSGIGTYAQDMIFDEEYNRLLICSYQDNCPIYAVNLPDGLITTAVETNLNNLDGLAQDSDGNVYVACWGTNTIYKYDNEFTTDPEIVSENHNGPSGIEINNIDNLLYVSNFYSDNVNTIPLSIAYNEEVNILEPEILLVQNYPNPFNPITTISFEIPDFYDELRIEIFNVKGQQVRKFTIFKNQPSIVWDGRDDLGMLVSSGIYFYALKSDKMLLKSKRMILLK